MHTYDTYIYAFLQACTPAHLYTYKSPGNHFNIEVCACIICTYSDKYQNIVCWPIYTVKDWLGGDGVYDGTRSDYETREVGIGGGLVCFHARTYELDLKSKRDKGGS